VRGRPVRRSLGRRLGITDLPPLYSSGHVRRLCEVSVRDGSGLAAVQSG
jgi:hypothetical protein